MFQLSPFDMLAYPFICNVLIGVIVLKVIGRRFDIRIIIAMNCIIALLYHIVFILRGVAAESQYLAIEVSIIHVTLRFLTHWWYQ